jgi:hypothetical protein
MYQLRKRYLLVAVPDTKLSANISRTTSSATASILLFGVFHFLGFTCWQITGALRSIRDVGGLHRTAPSQERAPPNGFHSFASHRAIRMALFLSGDAPAECPRYPGQYIARGSDPIELSTSMLVQFCTYREHVWEQALSSPMNYFETTSFRQICSTALGW